MKNLIYLVTACMLMLSCGTAENNKEDDGRISPDIVNNPATASGESEKKLPAFEFTESNFDFGTIKSGDAVSHDFKFTNTGNADLIIAQANGSCGCTVPEYSKDPIAPGAEGVIKVTFNSSGMAGQITKTVTLLANTIPATKVLTISAEVIK